MPKGYIRCDDEFAPLLPEEIQLEISNVGREIIMSIINGECAGIMVFPVPKEDGTKTIYINSFLSVQDALRAALHSYMPDKELLNNLMKAYKIEKNRPKGESDASI